MGQIHHINPIREGRFPLPFKWASKAWNLVHYKGVARGLNPKHIRAHKLLRQLDKLDLYREKSLIVRSVGNAIIQHVNDAGNGKHAVKSKEMEIENECLYAPDITIEIDVEINVEIYE